MSDVDAERRAMPPPRAAVPKAVAGQAVQPKVSEPEPAKRGPGRPPKADAFTTLRVIATELGQLDKATRRQVLETLLALSE